MQKSLSLLFCLMFGLSGISAQDLINNKDIVWIGDYTSYMVPKPMECWYSDSPAPFDYRFHQVKWQSLDNKQGYFGANEYELCEWLLDQILNNIKESNAECYADDKLEQRLLHDEILTRISVVDTVNICFPANDLEEALGVRIVRNYLSIEEIYCLKVRYRVFYNEKIRSFGAEMLAYAPMVKDRSNPDQPQKTKPLCWIKAPKPVAISPENIAQQPDINWAAQYRGNVIYLDSFQIIKQQMDLKRIVHREARAPGRTAYNYEFQPLTQAEIDQQIYRADTVVTFDPETYEEKVRIQKTEGLTNVKSINFVYLWYYDSRKRQLYAKPTFSVILTDVKDDQGNFRFSKPLFYQKME